MATNDDPEFEPVHASSPTDHVLTELQLYGHRPFQDDPDPRPLPEAQTITGAVVDIFDALVSTLTDTRLEPDLVRAIDQTSGWVSPSQLEPQAGGLHRALRQSGACSAAPPPRPGGHARVCPVRDRQGHS